MTFILENEMIKFTTPYIPGEAKNLIADVLESGHVHGDGKYTKLCQKFFEERYDVPKTLLTSSCTDALEMCAILLNLRPGDEIIIPDYTFVSTVNPFVLQGAKPVFVDSSANHPNICLDGIEAAITERTKAIVVVHYGGVALDMKRLLQIAGDIPVIEDAAHSIDSTYMGKQLGTFGALGTFSFHDTKNISCGEGGLLLINDEKYIERAEVIREKGTNRSSFIRGEVDKYGWVDVGSSFLPSELQAALLYSQLQCLSRIQKQRIDLWLTYDEALRALPNIENFFSLINIPDYSSNNAHVYYLVCSDGNIRNELLSYLKRFNIQASFHYQSLRSSKFGNQWCEGKSFENSIRFTNNLIRLPLHNNLEIQDILMVVEKINDFCFS